jgi:hypothetical protein
MKNIITIAIIFYSFILRSQCVNGVVEIKFDNYANETSWEITNSSGAILASGGPYTSSLNGTTQSYPICLTASACLNFKIKDSYGDGICCSYGNGYYNVKFNGTTLITGGQFTTSDTKPFCVLASGGGSATPTCSDGIKNGTETGIDCGGSCPACPTSGSNVNGIIEIRFDGYASETAWNIKNSGGSILASGGSYTTSLNNTLQTYPVSLPANACLTFTITDSYGDGICCNYGNGYYNVKFNGNVLATGGQFTSSDIKAFCVPASNTSSGGGPLGGPLTCGDGIKNGTETGIDCGGPSCPSCVQRNIVFVHGFVGSLDSWTKVRSLHSKNSTAVVSGWTPRKTDAAALTYNQIALETAQTEITTTVESLMSTMRMGAPVNSSNQDFLIAHSQGGLVSRALDRGYVLNNNVRPFNGLITFGTPHNGARIANNLRNGNVASWLAASCKRVIGGPFESAISNSLLFTIGGSLFDLSTIRDKVCDQTINATLPFFAPTSAGTINVDLEVGSTAVQALNNFNSPTLRKIAAYGIEEEPVFWREAYSLKNNINQADFFGADADYEFINDQTSNLSKSMLKIEEYYQKKNYYWLIPIVGSYLHTAQYLQDLKTWEAWKQTKDFWENANAEYKVLIGSTPTGYTFANSCKVSVYSYGSLVYEYNVNNISNPDICASYRVINESNETYCTPNYTYTTPVPIPSDGLVIATSAQAFPVAGTILMNGSNHQQMRNDSNTKNVLNTIYDGNVLNQEWFATSPR